MAGKTRLDKLLVARGLADTRSKAAAMIMAAEAHVDGRLVDKPGAQVAQDCHNLSQKKNRALSVAAALKLEAALDAFPVDASGALCADVGAKYRRLQRLPVAAWGRRASTPLMWAAASSTGGCAMMNGCACMKAPTRVIWKSLGEHIDLAVIDVSFISLRLILPAVMRLAGGRGGHHRAGQTAIRGGQARCGQGRHCARPGGASGAFCVRSSRFSAGMGLSPAGTDSLANHGRERQCGISAVAARGHTSAIRSQRQGH